MLSLPYFYFRFEVYLQIRNEIVITSFMNSINNEQNERDSKEQTQLPYDLYASSQCMRFISNFNETTFVITVAIDPHQGRAVSDDMKRWFYQ